MFDPKIDQVTDNILKDLTHWSHTCIQSLSMAIEIRNYILRKVFEGNEDQAP